jgi:TPR repeat protein
LGGVFISYRRSDSAAAAGRLADTLIRHFGADQVFFDRDGIEAGAAFPEVIQRVLDSCQVLLAVIGPQWLWAHDAAGRRRLDDPEDCVHREIASALGRADAHVIPILLNGVPMPPADHLPEPLAELAVRNARHFNDESWRDQIHGLTVFLETLIPRAVATSAVAAELRTQASQGVQLGDLVEDLDRYGDLPVVEALDPYSLGATISMAGDGATYGQNDEYVPRTAHDVDATLDRELSTPRTDRSRPDRQLVVLLGPSKAGKTRTAFEALRRTLPTARLAAPQPGLLQSLAAHPRWQNSSDPLVLWLDDLNRFITHAAPLTPAVLAAMHRRPGPVIAIATLRSEQRDLLRGGGGEFTRDTRMLLEAAHTIEMAPTSADPGESAAAATAYPELPQQAGLAAQLAGAPALLTRYRDAVHADPAQAAVVQGAIDWARVCRPDPIPEPTLVSVARQTLWDQLPDFETSDEGLRTAIRAARQPPEGAGQVAMLTTMRLDDHGSRGYRPFDFLVAADDGQDGHPARAIPETVWSHALADATPDDAYAIGVAGYQRHDHHNAGAAWARAADAGHIDAMNILGALACDADPPDYEAARRWWGRAASAADPDAMYYVGLLAYRADPPDHKTARRWWKRAAACGQRDAMNSLGALARYADPPDLKTARRWFERAADAGNTLAMVNLGELAREGDPPDLETARRWFERAAAGEDTAP